MIIGLSGNIACGKSTAAAIFKEHGCSVVDCDVIARNLLQTDPQVIQQLTKHWGAGIILPDGSIDRMQVASIVFKDSIELKWLEDLLHPKIHQIWKQQVALKPDLNVHWVVEIQLLFEKKLEIDFDLSVCITSSLDNQLTRLLDKSYSIQDAHSRMQCQMPLQEKMNQADIVITNDGSIDFLKKQIQLLIQTINLN